MTGTILVVTTVHWPDDTRIRERLIRSLSGEFSVVYAARPPGPSSNDGLSWLELSGGRIRRNLEAFRVALSGSWDVLVVHDPELIPCAIVARLVKRRPVVFDVHEDIPASAHTRAWVPRFVRRPLAALLRWVLRFSERILVVTLAEPGYQRLFRQTHPVFVNYPDTRRYPEPGGNPDGPVVYLGDVTGERGAEVAVAACSRLDISLRLIGRISATLQERLEGMWSSEEPLLIDGLVPNRSAIGALAGCSVGLAPLRDLPNYRHSQPTKILEYLAMGLPVVASDLPGTRQLVDELDGVSLVPPGEPEALAEAIQGSRSPDVMGRARSQASSIRERYGWPTDAVVEFYRSLL